MKEEIRHGFLKFLPRGPDLASPEMNTRDDTMRLLERPAGAFRSRRQDSTLDPGNDAMSTHALRLAPDRQEANAQVDTVRQTFAGRRLKA